MTEDTIVAPDADEIVTETRVEFDPDKLIPIPMSNLSVLLAAAAFARDLIQLGWEGATFTADDIHGRAEEYGLHVSRVPTGEELADPEWWGHAAGIKAGEPQVGEFSPGFQAWLDAFASFRPELGDDEGSADAGQNEEPAP